MEMVEIKVERRDGSGKGRARKMRRTGAIPAVFYGPKRTTVSVRVSAEEFVICVTAFVARSMRKTS